MSTVSEILERLSGISALREKMHDTTHRVEKLGDWLLDHEKRLITLETTRKLMAPTKRKK